MDGSTEFSLGVAIDRYIEELFVPPDPVLHDTLAELERAGLPPINVSPNEGKLLYLLAKMSGARKILEVGTLAGYSTIWLGRVLPADGHLISLEVDSKHATVSIHNLARAGLAGKTEVRLGPAKDSLEKIVSGGEGPFDLFFIDADKENNPVYLEYALKLARPGSVVLVDNVIRGGSVINPDPAERVATSVGKFNQALAADNRLESLIVPLIRERFDGLSISIVK